jgi:hypothetical protein
MIPIVFGSRSAARSRVHFCIACKSPITVGVRIMALIVLCSQLSLRTAIPRPTADRGRSTRTLAPTSPKSGAEQHQLTDYVPLWESSARMSGLISKISRRLARRYVPASQQPQKLLQYPQLEPSDVENARLFAGRDSLVKYLAPELKNGAIAEVGVMYGDFSDFIIRTIQPAVFVAIDRFDLHTVPVVAGKASAERFQGLTHREFYQRRFSDHGSKVRCEEGDSCQGLSRYPDRTFDMIYVDAGHDYESVKEDADLSKQKIKPDGILLFNDYIKYSHYDDSYYGVIPVVNDLVVNQGFEVVGFALQPDMYCDIAIRRRAKKN